jgi:ketosteroid isomerase-like protein
MTTAQTDAQQTVLDIALGYFDAWTARKIDEAVSFVADDVVFDAPLGRADGAAALRQGLEEFMQIFRGAELIDAFADEHSAVILYMTQTAPASDVAACEYLGIEDGKISYKRLIFDRLPFDE